MKEVVSRLWRRSWVWLLAGGMVAYAVTPPAFALDDAYISLHSARVLLQGADPAFGAPALVGATSPPFVALLTALLIAHLPAVRLATALGLVAFVAGLWTLGRSVGLSVARVTTIIALVLVSGFVFLNLRNGLETGWALASVAWLIVFAVREDRLRLAVLAGLLPAIRPDLAPTAALALLYGMRSRSWGERARMVGIAGCVAAPWFLWVRLDTGAWLPQTMRAKQYWFAEGCQPAPERVAMALGALADVGSQLLPFVLALPWLWRAGIGRIGLLSMAVTLAAYVWLFPGGLYHNYYRYPYVFLLPWGALGFMVLSHRINPPWISIALTVVATAYVWQLHLWPEAFSWHAGTAAELRDAAVWVDAHVPESAVVLVHDAGAMSEFGHHRLVDMVGLKTPSSIASHERYTWPSCGTDRIRAISEIARRSGASYLVVIADWARIFRIPTGLRGAGFDLATVRIPPDRDEGYYVFSLADSAPRASTDSGR